MKSHINKLLLDIRVNLAISIILLILVALIISQLYLLNFTKSIGYSPPKLTHYNTLECLTANKTNDNKLTIYVLYEGSARFLADHLCKSYTISNSFHKVIFSWQSDELSNLTVLLNKKYDLLVDTSDKIEIPLINNQNLYMPIASYAPYQGVLIGKKEKPVLQLEYLLNKKVGLLDDRSSRSGYIFPLMAFKEKNIDYQQLNLIYKKKHGELRKALNDGELDIIASYWNNKVDLLNFNYDYVLNLKQSIKPKNWYLATELIDTTIHCVLQNALSEMAQQSKNKYFSQLNTLRECSL